MIFISKTHYIAEGMMRKCYIHPSNKNLCIKIIKPSGDHTLFLKREEKYYKKIQKKAERHSLSFFAKYHGTINTNLGKGYVYELVKNADNSLSQSIEHYIKTQSSQFSDEVLQLAINNLTYMMVKYKIFSMDLEAQNLLCRIDNNNNIEIVIIDGMGYNEFLPLVDYSNFFARKKVKRKSWTMREYRAHYTTL